MKKLPLTVVKTQLSLKEISIALKISEKDALDKFTDARITSWFAEIWGERLFSYRKHINSNHPGSDAALDLGALGQFEISVRCFNKGTIKFQKSKHIGSGRSASLEDLEEALESVERVVIVDLRKFPKLSFYPIDSKSLLKLLHKNKLTTSGISPTRFDTWIQETFDITVQEIDLTPETAAMY
ncbi:MAG: hypothetical protein LKE94_09145 [Acetobacter fabarum]|jgi:hypothetical protein|uniref:hypothetical protein n=1 Tax=Acetobacter fabarum TaxID=483199 RepID=UPI00242C1A8B|nr:hypothetical protein [Acetobacter fabarum]MCH4025610.1 hypothetical protein [Acetobacter fabarum]MCH4054738.1 hypothetical protein [Acetobacter fabarum]MCH4086531.1 hypothetical protein [Acetobacter fabarum]MCH4138406.1 hypothetical protein [Acetobacter fabarum]MCI1322075.1 hypothetical protein [Acetobacter fabarum]